MQHSIVAQPAETQGLRYDPTTIALHWITALLVGVLLAIARFTHWLLYGLLIVAVVLGGANVWVRGDPIFNVFRIPAYDPGNRDLMHLVGGWHALATNAVVIVAGIHAAAALFHHLILRDATLRRMLPWDLR